MDSTKKRAGRPCWLRGPCAYCALLLFCAFTIAAYIGSESYLADTFGMTNRIVNLSTEVRDDFRSEIASKLQELTSQIQYETNNSIDPTILLELNKIVSQLDPRYALDTVSLLASPPPVPDTCGEVFNGTLYGYRWYRTGFVELPSCKRDENQPIHKLVTILLLDREHDINKTSDVLQTIRSYNSEIPVVLGSTASVEAFQSLIAEYKNIITVSVDHEDLLRPGKILNLMIEKIKTPYVLIARDVYYFDDLARLERQVFVISSTNAVGIAGGAYRNESGYWKVGCHFSEINNYFLKYTEGYKYSALDCMLCDHLEGPFVAKTSIMKRIPFNKNLCEEVLYEDWFLRVKQNHILSMNCPDVMYYKRGAMEGVPEEVKLREHSSWLDLAREWQVDHVYFPFRVSIKFTCKELKVSCDVKQSSKAFVIPTCCMKQVTGALKALDSFSTEKGVDYEIISGTLLGAVKLRNFMPWDVEGDMTFCSKDYDTFHQNTNFFSKKGFSLSNFRRGQNQTKKDYFRINTPEIMLEMWGSQTSMFQLPEEMWEYPTRVKINGIWVRGEWNPGLYARNRYGPGFLKHVQHWRIINKTDSSQIYNSGSWLSCPKKAHHACLDKYPTDGSEGFLSQPEI